MFIVAEQIMSVHSLFKDYFSIQAEDYSVYRPEYPVELFEWLASLCPEQLLAWDCGTGNGQAAVALTHQFSYVIGTDASQAQIDSALIYPRVEYETALAEKSPLKSAAVDLITVAQALHWFDFDAFFKEVTRVAKPQAVLAFWCYGLMDISPEVDDVVSHYYHDVIGDHWPKERQHIENQYADIRVPFEPIPSPRCVLSKQWTFKHLVGYLGTWSATQRYIEQHREDPRAQIVDALKAAWGSDETKTVNWPMTIKTFRVKP